MKVWKYLSLVLIGFLAVTLTSCGGSSDGGGSTGQLSLELTDAPGDYKAVYVTITEIQVHRSDTEEGTWQTILTPNATYNLLDLRDGKTASLGVANLPIGTYTQLRLILAETNGDSSKNILGEDHPYANYVIEDIDGSPYHELKVPSGYTSGIKLVHTFEIESDRPRGLVLDFDASRSVVKAGNSGQWLLKPTIKIIDTVYFALLTGLVTTSTGPVVPDGPIGGATVSAQTYNADTHEVTIVQSTETGIEGDNKGEYQMYLEAGVYNIVVTADGFSTACRQITVDWDDDYILEAFRLAPAMMEWITIDLTLPLDSLEESATIEFRQNTLDCGVIAVKNVNYIESGLYLDDFSLPSGTYSVVATCADEILTDTVTIPGDNTISFDFINP